MMLLVGDSKSKTGKAKDRNHEEVFAQRTDDGMNIRCEWEKTNGYGWKNFLIRKGPKIGNSRIHNGRALP